jgi:hypothetical protein
VRTLTKSFLVIAGYLVAIAAVYWLLTGEEAGTFLVLGSAATVSLVSVYLARRGALGHGPAHPEDDPDGDIAAAAGGRIGSFPFSSVWPIVFVAGSVLVALGALYTAILLPLGGVVVALAVVGLMRESRA